MTDSSRFSTLKALFVSALFVTACGGTPQVTSKVDPDGGPSVTYDSGIDGTGGTGNNPGGGSGPTLNLDGGSKPPIGAGGEAGASDSGPVCGDGVVDAPETCDDGNAKPGDGCDGNCTTEKNWDCPKPGQKCVQHVANAVCGNGVIENMETCDLGKGKNDGTMGCAADCLVVNGWSCPASGEACSKDAFCGDSIVQNTLGEQCDDGTNDGTHGCDSKCLAITGWKCPQTGGPCTVDVACGNGKVDTGEQCDDHNLRSYDGCTSTCFTEAGWSCPATGGTCTRICGNGLLDPGETCDDSNIYSGDGCSSLCKTEPNYTCATAGQSCVFTPPPAPAECGNGKAEIGEGCDDGNTHSGDGCSSTCTIESGWKCGAQNTPCTAAQCGDGILAGTEQCDDHIVDNAHGCSSTCTIMPNAVCPANGGACVPMVCGDGKVTGTETCDSGLNDGKHGCSTTCQTMTGWICPLAGAPCTEVCGDGIVVGDEQCDEKADVACCSATCQLKAGYVCDPSKNPHSQVATPYCGNGTVNGPSNPASTVLGSEQCDDGNKIPFDGCSPTCTNEPLCGTTNTYNNPATTGSYQCFAHCGDGVVVFPEECDDGNTVNKDGCDSSCKIELVPNTTQPAWTCSQPLPGTSITLPIILRDFSTRSHPQFQVDPMTGRRLPNIPQSSLQQVAISPGKFKYVPAYNTAFKSPTWGNGYTNMADWTMNGPGWVSGSEGYKLPIWMTQANPPAYDVVWWSNQPATLTSATGLSSPSGRFAQWYVDDASVNISFPSSITLNGSGGSYQYSCGSDACDDPTFTGNPTGFYPLDGKGWVAANKENARDGGHNYSFTTESRSWFAFKGGEQLAFYGDDDLWVFVNGQLTLDIGGLHQQLRGNFTLNDNGTATTCVENLYQDGGNTTNCSTVNLGLVKKNVYEIAIFNAEREITQSNFQLTLVGFNNSPSVCTPICGDGFAAGSEQCDRGTLNVAPTGSTYGKCTTQCKLGAYCGDDKLQKPPELCDNGINFDSYVSQAPTASMCAPGCVAPTYCGDGVVQKANGEECDNTTANNQNAYGKCQVNCKLGARCGDSKIQGGNGETCDDGANNGSPSSACDATCHKKCGNQVVETGEDCDDGANNGTNASGCDTSCKFKCGNGQLDVGEDCDDGKNDGSYGTCKSNCKFAPFCGDSTLQSPPEACDLGAANASNAYGANSCTDQCVPGGLCGDGIVNGDGTPAHTEKCDDGKNTGLPGSCKTDCSGYVPSTLCGDGKIQAPETCDDGTGANGNGSAASKCDAGCRIKCGNALVDSPEQCDNGVNDGSYGTCNANCTLAGYCGDNVKNGNEQCDLGAKNVLAATAYGSGVCTKACKAAPFCGDGRIQAQYGEECEGNDGCADCKLTGPK